VPELPSSAMPPSSPSRWNRWLLALGPLRATLLLTALGALAALVLSEALLLLSGRAPHPVAALLALACALLLVPPLVLPLLRYWRRSEDARAEQDLLAARDDLTGACSRRQFLALAEREWSRCRRYEMPAALLLVDIDHFRRVNDLHGRPAGDRLLRAIAHATQETLRQADLLGRFGGEEFVVFLAHADTLGALDAAERIRDKVARLTLEAPGGEPIRTTVSVGVVALARGHETLTELLADAERALQAAKDAGRNCVRTPPAPAAAAAADAEPPRDQEGRKDGPRDTRAK
jgi:diguanylate cyclase